MNITIYKKDNTTERLQPICLPFIPFNTEFLQIQCFDKTIWISLKDIKRVEICEGE